MTVSRKTFGKRGVTPVPTAFASRTPEPDFAPARAQNALVLEDENFSGGKAAAFGLGLFFSFNGRISRGPYWMIGTVRFVLMMAVIFGYAFNNMTDIQALSEDEVFAYMVGSTAGLTMLALVGILTVCAWSLEARRCHDRDVSAWWLLLYLIPFFGALYGAYLFVVNGFFKGTPGANRFGPP
ncbi:DUF805 domain-containing protein [Roseibium denhamense]|uniref:Uncharacterized membrane protein YhaH, DUF805 family n=1 Tax=Roseibium denhamense TaxID=76305 RepID=A0ABY1P3T8_9HYPH|nr:DUF805 domain-containing protein [Roseibium denhamense]MTI07627.1 DUF805 domain-containing protein [Roseibium denhamense]SMP24212.1 Uncharacterized membrane protein YhaH, DUF805 family [Roseibium denhamense]